MDDGYIQTDLIEETVGTPSSNNEFYALVKKLAISVVAISFLFLVFSGSLLWHSSQMADINTLSQIENIIQARVDRNAVAMTTHVREYAWWESTLENIVETRNDAWLENNFGVYLAQNFDLHELLVIGSNSKGLYAEQFGEEVSADEFLNFNLSQLLPLINQTQSSPNNDPVPSVGFLIRGKELFLVSACVITTDDLRNLLPDGVARPTLLFIRKFDYELQRIATDLGLLNIEWSPNRTAEPEAATAIAITTPDGEKAGYIHWKAPLPGGDILQSTLLWVSPSLVLFLLLGGYLGRWFRRRIVKIGEVAVEAALVHKSQQHFQAIANDAPVLIWETNAVAMITYTNRHFLELLGKSATAHHPLNLLNLIADSDRTLFDNYFKKIHGRKDAGSCEIRIKNSEDEQLSISITCAQQQLGGEVSYIFCGNDITERIRIEKSAWHQANYDNLTQLPNRNLLQNRLEQELKCCERNKSKMALIFIDLDNFKDINDSRGHNAGDQVLKEAATRIVGCLRNVDTVARMGGDEFVLLLPINEHTFFPDKITSRILASLAQPFQLERSEVYLSASIGLAIYPADGGDSETLMMNADTAMYQAKRLGKNQISYYSPIMNADLKADMQLEVDLHKALDNDEFFLLYQPIVDLSSQKVIGAEALARWRRADGSIVSPDKFIPLLEKTGMIKEVGIKILTKACQQLRRWKNSGIDIYMAVNVSSVQFRDKNLVNNIEQILTSLALEPSCLQLELTEHLLIEDSDQNLSMLNSLVHKGIKLAIDDFGTGYSALSYLQKYSVDVLKIDRSFITEIPDKSEGTALVKAIIAMARSLHLTVVAEGVENIRQNDFLLAEHCERAQGYLYSRPLEAKMFTELFDPGLKNLTASLSNVVSFSPHIDEIGPER